MPRRLRQRGWRGLNTKRTETRFGSARRCVTGTVAVPVLLVPAERGAVVRMTLYIEPLIGARVEYLVFSGDDAAANGRVELLEGLEDRLFTRARTDTIHDGSPQGVSTVCVNISNT